MDDVMLLWGQLARVKHIIMFRKKFARWRCQLDVRQLRCFVKFVRM